MCIAIPASVVCDTPHLREKTSKIGLIGRAAAIFRVDEIIVYRDNPKANQEAEMELIALLLSYMETPQYLRKRLFKLRPQLRYAGILPPLRTPHHPLNRRIKDLKINEHREGLTLSKTRKGTFIDVGVEEPVLIPNKQLPINRRVTVKITKVNKRVEAALAYRDEIRKYWGYSVTLKDKPIGKLLKAEEFDLIIATSKYGVPVADVAEEISEKWKKADRVLIAFGAPTQGLYEMFKKEKAGLDDAVDFVVNTVPLQGTETVRTEEALFSSLAVLASRLF